MATLQEEISRRRTFAIISHPDAGKTTLTEKFLLYGGAIAQAGEVKGKRERAAKSDWMEIEKQRGISVTSSVMQFQHGGYCINILDTPGHQDFSEDTYRTLMAADSAVMVIDGAKGVEPQTRKLFKVCALRNIPIFTFINKMDRETRDPLELCEEVERELGIDTYPVNWPIGCGKEFAGVYDRDKRCILHFTDAGHAKKAGITEIELDDPALVDLIGQTRRDTLAEEVELLGAGRDFDLDAVRRGKLSPVFFGSALTNFGVEPFLNAFLEMTTPPLPRVSDAGEVDVVLPRILGFRLQDPGQYEQGPPRPSCVHAHLLGQIRARHRVFPRPVRPQNASLSQPQHDDGRRARDRRRGLRGRHHRRVRSRYLLDRRHDHDTRQEVPLLRHPDVRARALHARLTQGHDEAQAVRQGRGADRAGGRHPDLQNPRQRL